MPNIKKVERVDQLLQLISGAPHFVLVKHEKTTHKALEELRKELKKSESKLQVVKNSLFEKAFIKFTQSKKDFKELIGKVFPLRENTAVLTIGEDYAKALNAFWKFAKADQTLSFKFGLLDGALYLGVDLEKIAQLPGKEELLAKLIGGLKSPSSKLVHAMKFNITKLTLVLKERSKQVN